MRVSTVSILVLLLFWTAFIGFLPSITNAQETILLSESVADNGMDIVVCTYFGGTGQEWTSKSDFDSEGNLVLTGMTMSVNLPLMNANQTEYGGLGDAFILKMTLPSETVFATYFGGNGLEESMALIVDDDDNIIIAGSTSSTDLPLLNPIQPELNGTTDGFIAKFSPSGNLLFSTYLGGSEGERIERIGIDSNGNYLITGRTESDDYPITPGVVQENFGGGETDIFITALSEDGQTIAYSTYFGNAAEEVGLDIDVDLDGNLVIVGLVYDTTNTTDGVYQREYGGGQSDSVIAKFNSDCTELIWSTLFGGDGWDFGDDVDFDSENNIVVSGYTGSSDFPLVNQLYNNSPNNDAFFAKLNPSGETLLLSSYLGGNLEDRSYGMEVLSDDSIIISSPATSTDMPTLNAAESNNSGYSDGYFAILSDNELVYATYLGGESNDYVMGLSVYEEETVAIVGYTYSQNLTLFNPFQEQYAGNGDVVIWILQPLTENTVEIPWISIATIAGAGVLVLIVLLIVNKKR